MVTVHVRFVPPIISPTRTPGDVVVRVGIRDANARIVWSTRVGPMIIYGRAA